MNNNYPELYTKGCRVWIPHQDEVWTAATVKANYDPKDKKILVEDDEGNEQELSVPSNDQLPPLRNPDILLGTNDLVSLSYLHEPAVLYNLRVRFLDREAIYTWCGIVLVAINPFADLNIYGEETIQTYHHSMGQAQLDPHIYAVAEDAYSKLERDNYNQSIIVSGESGAGKTVSAKFAMRYFASIASSNTSNIENRVLASNPIMEAIGNAKTVRNDNSSRFGKYIQILFDQKTRAITGGSMRTYLLEKSRVTSQNEGERNFHIFYQMCSYAKSKKLSHLKLDKQFKYLGGIEPNGADDMSKFHEALHVLGFSDRHQNLIFEVVAAILHGGDIVFKKLDDEKCTISPDDIHLKTFCELLGLDESATIQWLTHRLLRTGGKEMITTPLDFEKAQYGRDALLKLIYEKMFLWVVGLINKALGPAQQANYQFIGVLDIYGFEHFETNSFEQFCINYANEVLQQQFNQHVFKLEQEEYVREGIDWTFITFTDNQPVIDLIESKPIGILNLLDEECRMPKGSDETWCAKLYDRLTVGEIFQKPKFGSRNSFFIQHFADKVIYSVEGFLEKNRDTIWEEQVELLRRSDISLLFADDLLPSESQQKSGGRLKVTAGQQQKATKSGKATVGSQFRESLALLMKTLNSTEPHYVRCIKPNDDKAAFTFVNTRAIQQLRACGVLETIRISSNGFPSRWSYADFANRYRVLLAGLKLKRPKSDSVSSGDAHKKLGRSGSSNASEIRLICEDIVRVVYEEQVYSRFKLPFEEQQKESKNIYQFGKTKIFFRAGQVALLERIRAQKLRDCATLIQRMIRGWLARQRYQKIRGAIIGLQTRIRGLLARRYFQHLRRTKAAITIQSAWRRYRVRKVFLAKKRSALLLQKFGRGLLARRRFRAIKQESAAITIQRFWRGYRARKWYKKQRRDIIIIQNLVRRRQARKILKELRKEARSVEHVKQLNKGLERKIIELQQRIEDLNHELKSAKATETGLDDFKKTFSAMEEEMRNLKDRLHEREVVITTLRQMLETQTKDGEELSRKVQKYEKMIEAYKAELAKPKIVEAPPDPKKLEAEVRRIVAEREKAIRDQFEKEKRLLIEERESERAAHQQLLRRYAALEEKLMGNVEEEEDKSPYKAAVINGHNNQQVVETMPNGKYLGMFEYKQQHEGLLLRILISDLTPDIALNFQPHLPAYIIFMCIRYTDYINDDTQVRTLLNETIMSIKRTIKRKSSIETYVMWLSYTCMLITLLKQYSGDETFGVFDESLKNFDLSEYRQILSDLAVWIYQGVIKQAEERIQPLIVPAVLEYEGLATSGVYNQPSNMQRAGSIGEQDLPSPSEKPIESLITELSYIRDVLMRHAVDEEIIHQVFKQLFYFICAGALNNLLLRKDLCHWNKAMQIRFNLSSLEQWCREQLVNNQWNGVVDKLDPIIQATKLLQTKKTEDHIPTIVEMCNKLTSSQIIKILNLYTAGDEEHITTAFMKKLQQHLAEVRTETLNPSLLMDTKFAFAVVIPYHPTDVTLQSISIPPILMKKGLGTVLKKL